MRYVLTGLLSAALLLGCSDDDGSPEETKNDGSVLDSGTKDGGGGGGKDASSLDASLLDAALRDASGNRSDASIGGATATLVSKSGSTTTGEATFTSSGGRITLNLTVRGATPGKRGAHIHAVGDCSAADASTAGTHWNPAMRPHGSGSHDAGAISHLGDLGNLDVKADGVGTLTISKPEWTLGDGAPTDVIGKAIVIHKNEDDLVTQNGDAGPGNSGARVACGVIAR